MFVNASTTRKEVPVYSAKLVKKCTCRKNPKTMFNFKVIPFELNKLQSSIQH